MKKLESTHLPEGAPPGSRQQAAELARELERERQAHRRAAFDAERHRRYARAIDRLCCAVLAEDGLDKLLQKLVEIFVQAARADVGVLRLREGDRLRPRASVGLEEEVSASFSAAVPDPGDGAGGCSGEARAPPVFGAAAISESLRAKGMHAQHCLNLLDGENLVGSVILGALDERELSGDERQLLGMLASRAAAAIRREAAEESLREAIRARDDVLSAVAHDLKNPVNAISIAAGAMLRRTEDSEARRPFERILRGVDRADRLLRHLLDVNAIEAGRLSIEKRRLEPANLILAALESQHALAEDASVIIGSDLSPGLPAIEADEERLLEVFENLIGNAMKFTDPGGSVAVGASRRDDEILLWVKDSGSGIAAEELPHVFDRFWHARNTRRRGTGLGLTICRGIVEAHGGHLWLDSTAGQGTTAFFTLPIAAGPARRGQAVEPANILLVDDRPENLTSLKAILDRSDYRLVTATSGEEALALALRERFALALIDVAMPGMNGLEVAVHLKELERSRDIPIIFITAFGSDPQEIHQAYAAGGADYLVKPLDPEIVRKKAAVFVDLSRRRSEKNPRSRPD